MDLTRSLNSLEKLDLLEIQLQNNGLRKLPIGINKLKNLKKINIDENYFDSIPNVIFELENLRELSIQANNSTLKFIGQEIHKISQLEKLNVALNPLLNGTEAIISISQLNNLKELDLFSCRFKVIPQEIGNLKKLEKLNLSRNPDIDFEQTLKFLSNIESLKHLNISDNNLTTLPREIGLLNNLETLVVGLNPINTLPDEFYNLKSLKYIYVYGDYDSEMSEEIIEEITKRLPNCQISKDWVFRTNN